MQNVRGDSSDESYGVGRVRNSRRVAQALAKRARIAEAGTPLGLGLLDHIVVGHGE